MPFLLSIRTVFPRKGGRIWYDDQRHVHQQIFAGDEELEPDPSDLLPRCLPRAVPGHHPDLRRGLGPSSPDRAHRVRRTRRCHRHRHSAGPGRTPLCAPPSQAEAASGIFPRQRARTITGARFSSLPDDHLLDAAHIMADAHEMLGQPLVANGIALSKNPPRRLRQPSGRHRPRRSGTRLRTAAEAPRRTAARAEP